MGSSMDEFGSWKSPITSILATKSSLSFQEVHLDKTSGGLVYWSELRYDEAGRYVICSSDGKQWTPKDYNARTSVHEYGGGSFFVHNGTVYFSNFFDQRLYVQTCHDAKPTPLTPADSGWRYADGYYCEKHGLIYCVREDHSVVDKTIKTEALNTVVCINPKTEEQFVLVKGCDFYSRPRVSPDGKKLIWMQWNHPNMPWDSTEVCVADISDGGYSMVDGTTKVVAGENNSVMSPDWSCDGHMMYISDKTDWWNLYQVTGNEHVNLTPVLKEVGNPHWTFAYYTVDIDRSGSGKAAVCIAGVLNILDIQTKVLTPLNTGFDGHRLVQYHNGVIFCVASGPKQFPCVIKVEEQSGKVQILKESRTVPVNHSYFSIPTEIRWPTTEGKISYGFFYPPQNKDYTGPSGGKPSLLVKAHGGPTGQTFNTLNLNIQYFTSRGFAVLDVNYRGSTGYGKQYRHTLRTKWGIYDLDDCCAGAQHLAKEGKVDGNRLCIDGGSAGGYTTLACLAFKDVFKAGCSHYGIGDLEMLARDTHKFESRYLDTMIGPYSGEHINTYKERSPINYIDQFSCPIAFFQGDEDQIVLPNQAESMFKAVKDKGLLAAYVLFKGEQHGFRKAENIQMALDGEFLFFSKVFGFKAADNDVKLDIFNM